MRGQGRAGKGDREWVRLAQLWAASAPACAALQACLHLGFTAPTPLLCRTPACPGCHCQVVIFPKTPEHLKTPTAEEAFNPNGLAQRSITLLKDKFPDLEVGGCQAGVMEGKQ